LAALVAVTNHATSIDYRYDTFAMTILLALSQSTSAQTRNIIPVISYSMIYF